MAAVNLIFYLWLVSFLCYSQESSILAETSQNIDQFIETNKINKQCLQVKFGADAVTAISTSKGIVVIDAGISSGLTARYRKIIENEFHRNDFVYVINTHGHPDHTSGNCIFQNASIAGHMNCLKEISCQCKNPEKRVKHLGKIVEEYELKLQVYLPYTKEWNEIFTQKIRYLNAYNDAKNSLLVKAPDIIFNDSLNINLGDVTFEMFYFGKCHSDSDILIYVPQMKILFTGDLFCRYGKPDINDKHMTEKNRWSESVRWIEKRMTNIEKIICGHGEILTVDDLKNFNNKIVEKLLTI